jgi:ribosomal protein L37E
MSTADWWAKQLGAQPAQPVARPADVPMPPSQQPMATMPQPAYTQPLSKAQSASQTDSCPECGGNNYMAVQNAAARCYDCGYPITQAGSRYGSLTGATVEGSAKSAQGNDVQSNWNPQGIIGRVN